MTLMTRQAAYAISVRALLLITLIVVYVPLSPEMPEAGLDPSWMFALNDALARGLIFGKDVVFTFGPYVSLWTELYHPDSDAIMVAGNLFLALVLWAMTLTLFRDGSNWCLVLLCLTLLCVTYSRDTLFLVYILVSGLTFFELAGRMVTKSTSENWVFFLSAVIFFPVGMICLVKGSFLVLAVAVVVFCGAYSWGLRQRSLALIPVASLILSSVFFWLIVGQPLAALYGYTFNLVHLISGYTDAMGLYGRETRFSLVVCALACMAQVWSILNTKYRSAILRVCLAGVYAAYLLICYKNGFTRHGGSSVGTNILLGLIFLTVMIPLGKSAKFLFFFAALAWLSTDEHYKADTLSRLADRATEQYTGARDGLILRSRAGDHLGGNYLKALAELRKQAPLPVLAGTTDIYSWGQSGLIASGNEYSPRPVIQSYSAYTPALAEMNRRHLIITAGAPDNVLFEVAAIDLRFRSLADGASWRELLLRYSPVARYDNYLHLKRLPAPAASLENLPEIEAREVSFGEQVMVPDSPHSVYVKLNINKTLVGRFSSMALRADGLKLSLRLRNGEVRDYRLIAGMARTGFLLSPLIESTNEFGLLYGVANQLSHKKVLSFSVESSVPGSRDWADTYQVSFESFAVPGRLDMAAILGFSAPQTRPAGSSTLGDLLECRGGFDHINGVTPGASGFPLIVSRGKVLFARGWVIDSVVKPVKVDSVQVLLLAADGRHHSIESRTTRRLDVGVHFGNSELDNTGFELTGDLSELPLGRYKLGLGLEINGKVHSCPSWTDIEISD